MILVLFVRKKLAVKPEIELEEIMIKGDQKDKLRDQGRGLVQFH